MEIRIELNGEDARRLDFVAGRSGVPRDEVIRRAIAKYLAERVRYRRPFEVIKGGKSDRTRPSHTSREE